MLAKPRPNFEAVLSALNENFKASTSQELNNGIETLIMIWTNQRDIYDLTVRVEKLGSRSDHAN